MTSGPGDGSVSCFGFFSMSFPLGCLSLAHILYSKILQEGEKGRGSEGNLGLEETLISDWFPNLESVIQEQRGGPGRVLEANFGLCERGNFWSLVFGLCENPAEKEGKQITALPLPFLEEREDVGEEMERTGEKGELLSSLKKGTEFKIPRRSRCT